MQVLTMLEWFIVTCTSPRSPVRANIFVANCVPESVRRPADEARELGERPTVVEVRMPLCGCQGCATGDGESRSKCHGVLSKKSAERVSPPNGLCEADRDRIEIAGSRRAGRSVARAMPVSAIRDRLGRQAVRR